jgi:hypothetical protein
MTIQQGALFFILISFFIVFIFLYNEYDKKKQKEKIKKQEEIKKFVQKLKNEYEEALKSGDKKNALKCGREYYSFIRGGHLSIYDESAITNDLVSMGLKD